MVEPSSLGGVPVLSRPSEKPAVSRLRARETEGGSPKRPAGVRWSPRWIIPRRKVPVVSTTAGQAMHAPIREFDAGDGAGFGHDPGRFPFDDCEVRSPGDKVLHGAPVELAVGLGARPLNGGALAAVEHPELDAGRVGGAPHHAVERVDLAHQMALAQAADGGVARHFANGGEAMGDERGRGARARGRRRGFTARMSAADHHDVKLHLMPSHSRATRSITIGRPHPNPLPEGEGARRRRVPFSLREKVARRAG